MGIKWVWCGICVKYLTFGTYPTSTVGAHVTITVVSLTELVDMSNALLTHHIKWLNYNLKKKIYLTLKNTHQQCF